MATAPDTPVVTGQTFQQIATDSLLVTPTGLTQQTLANALGLRNVAGIATADPHVVGQVWANSGVLTVSAG